MAGFLFGVKDAETEVHAMVGAGSIYIVFCLGEKLVLARQCICITLLSSLTLTACREDEKIIAYRKLTSLPRPELERRVTALPPHEQVAMYVMAGSYFRPGDDILAPILARQGTHILPALIEQLEKEEKGVSPQHLVLVLDMMAHNYHVEEVLEFAPRIHGWCSRYYVAETYCHSVGKKLMDERKPRQPSPTPADDTPIERSK